MNVQILATLLGLSLVLVPAAVFGLAARRLVMSRSWHAVLYWLVGGFAFAGAAGALQTGLAGRQVDAGGMVVALASLPLWCLVRHATLRHAAGYGAERPVFTSVRRRLRAGTGDAISVP